MSHRRSQYNHSDLYGINKHEIPITEGNPVNDPRVIQYKRQINQLKEKIELQAELNRQLERDKADLQSQLDGYKKRCVDLQKNLDDKDQHLNEVVATLTMQHSKPVPVKKKKERSGWFGFGTPKPNKLTSTPNSSIYSTPSHIQQGSPISSPNIDINDDYISSNSPIDHNNNNILTMTAPIGVLGSSLPTIATRPRRHGSVHILDCSNNIREGDTISIGTMNTHSLIGIDKSEMEFKIKNCSKDKLRSYVRDLFDGYFILDREKQQLFQDLIKATHNQGWTEKEARNKDQQAKTAIEKEKYAKNHIKMLEKSLNKERKKIEKYRISFEDFKINAIKKRKELLINDKKLQDIISMKDEFIQRACYKLIVYKDRLAQFEIPVFQEYVILISPNIQDLMRYDGEGMNGPGSNNQNLSSLHEDMVSKQTPGGPGFSANEDINSAGGTVTSITSNGSRRKSSSRKSSLASANNDNDDNIIGDINDKSEHKKNKKKRKKKHKVLRVKSYDDKNEYNDDDLKQQDLINIPINAKSKTKKKKKLKRRSSTNTNNINNNTESLSNLSKKIDRKKYLEEKKRKKEEKVKKKAAERKEKIKEKMEAAAEEDYLEMDLDDMVSSSSSSSEEEDDFLLLSDSGEQGTQGTILEYALDENGKYIEDTNNNNFGISNNLSNYVELKLVKYPGTGELFVVITKFDDKKDQMEIFRSDFAKCLNIEKNQIEEDFSMYFEHITLVFRGDDYEKVRNILINLRVFFEQHCTNMQPELPTPPEQTVTDQMNIFFGGGF